MNEVYVIRKLMTDRYGKKINVLLTDGHSEVLEFNNLKEAEKITLVLNENSDSGWFYSVVTIKK
jgi:prepilin-type processing-associated H-X9-DG protein